MDMETGMLTIILGLLLLLLVVLLYNVKKHPESQLANFYIALSKAFFYFIIIIFLIEYDWSYTDFSIMKNIFIALAGLEFIDNILKAVHYFPQRYNGIRNSQQEQESAYDVTDTSNK